MADLNDVALFVQVVRSGSFSEAGRRLGVPANSVSRRIQELEDQLGARLMQRTTRKLTLTDAGRSFHDRCASLVDGLEEASEELVAGSRTPSGLVRVAATVGFLDFYKPEWVASFLEKHPRVRLEFLLDDAFVDLIAERIDVAFRSGRADDAGYVARRITTTSFSLFASPGYIARRGAPKTLQDLADHDCLTMPTAAGRAVWRLQGPSGVEEEIEARGRFATNATRDLWSAAVAGLGVALLPDIMAAADFAAGRLTPVLPQYKRPSQIMSVVYPSRRQVSPAVKAFVDSAVEKIEGEIARYRLSVARL